MTISTEASSATFPGSGITGPFPCNFRIFDDGDVAVSLVDPVAGTSTPLVLNTDYTIVGAGDQSGFTLATMSPVAVGINLLVSRNIAYEQPTDLTNQGAFFPTMHEDAFDRTVMQVQQIRHMQGLSLTFPDGLSPSPSSQLPFPLPGSLLGWSQDGSSIVNTGASGVGAGSIADANVSSGAAIQGTKLNFIQSGTGAIARTVQDKQRDSVSVFDFMTVAQIADAKAGTKVYDLTTAMQAAHNTGKIVYYPAGTYLFSTITMSAGGIVGDGKQMTTLVTSNITNNDLITFTGNTLGPIFRNFTINGSLSKTGGAAILFLASSGELTGPVLQDIYIYNVPCGIKFSNTAKFTVRSVHIINYSTQGIYVQNSNNPDSGDSCISDCFLNTSTPAGSTYGIWYRSSGGLKVVNTKILGGNSGFVLGFTGTANAADLLISNCSIENTLSYAIYLGRDSGTFSFGGVLISNVEIGCNNGIGTDNTGFLTLLLIDNCYINCVATASTCISLNNISNVMIGSNVLQTRGDASSFGINLQNITNGKVARQIHVATLAANRVSNGSPLGCNIELDQQVGSGVSVTTSAAYGSLYQGSTAVTFPIPFSTIPTVSCSASGAGGAIGAIPVSVTVNGFTLNVVGVTNGGVVSGCSWKASGII